MRKIIFIVLVFAWSVLVSHVVFGVGSGGGGAAPSCTEDTWTCGDWSSCSEAGRQTRTCTLSFDCSSASTPKPAEDQTCTPPPPVLPPPPQAPRVELKQENQAPPKPSCTADTWTCASWSASCDTLGRQSRTCTRSFDCPGAETPSPLTTKACDHLQCGTKTDLRDRVFCRLNLAPAGVAQELKLQYLPEECRVIKDHDGQETCEERYKSFKPCWDVPAGESRFECARKALALGPAISEEVKTCQGKKGSAQVACKTAVKDKVFGMIKFRFYDLEQRAEHLAERGADLGAVADLEKTIEEKKQVFNQAATNDERRQIVQDVRAVWRGFVAKVKDQVK